MSGNTVSKKRCAMPGTTVSKKRRAMSGTTVSKNMYYVWYHSK